MQPTRTPLNTELRFTSSAPKLTRGMIDWVAKTAAPPRMILRVGRGSWPFLVIFALTKIFSKLQFQSNAEFLSNGSVAEDSHRDVAPRIPFLLTPRRHPSFTCRPYRPPKWRESPPRRQDHQGRWDW